VSEKAETARGSLIARRVFFENPDRAGVRISPDGRHISYIAPLDGVLNIWVAPREDLRAARPITHDAHRGIHDYSWCYTNEHIVYVKDQNGDENWRVYRVKIDGSDLRDLTPIEGVAAGILQTSPRFPSDLLVNLNDRTPELHDVVRINLLSGERTRVFENTPELSLLGYVADLDLNVRVGMGMTEDGGMRFLRLDGGAPKEFLRVSQEDSLTTNFVSLDATGRIGYLTDNRDRNTSALFEIDMSTLDSKLIAEDSDADVADVLIDAPTRRVVAAAAVHARRRWQPISEAVKRDFAFLEERLSGDIQILSQTDQGDLWMVCDEVDNGPARYYLFDRGRQSLQFLFVNRTSLDGLNLARMRPVEIATRDGLKLVGYLTLPTPAAAGESIRPATPLPMVLLVHGGPWARDEWGYDPLHQWLANRGYAVLAVNFRGSTGFGKNFINAGDRAWGAQMHTDLLDAVDWATREKVCDPKRVAIMGGSYGGYAVLWAMTNSAEVFACGVDIVGPSNLITLLNSIPPYWQPAVELFAKRVGDHRTADGQAFLAQRSPLTYVNQIRRPLLIGQGANDPRVKQAESDQIVKAMQAKNIPVTYVLFPDEGHGFARPENNLAFFAIAEQFLAIHLGGAQEPIGSDLDRSSVQAPAGAELVPGFAEALPAAG
jgi:dipeptidyl aminopeptidase/acylaminoacyl peptidase